MPAKSRVPKYCLHRPSGRAYMRIRGRVRYLGPYDSPESHEKYGQLVAELAVSSTVQPTVLAVPCDFTVVELAAAYLDFAETYYRKNGEPTRTTDEIRRAIDFTTDRYGRTPVKEFGPLALIALQGQLVEKGLSRGYINALTRKIRQMFKWGVSRQLIEPAIHQALTAVEGLKKGRTPARETQPVRPVGDEVVEATLPHLPPIVADMVRLQRLMGCRPGEICSLRPMDLDRSSEVWSFKPASHKNEHHEHQRIIFVGPRAQAILLPYLLRPANRYCFSPAESVARRNVAMRACRKTRVQPSQMCRKKTWPKRVPKDRYTRYSYRQAITRAVKKANRAADDAAAAKGTEPVVLEHWHPNQLRHTAGTLIRRQYGLEAAQVVLGHAKADVTQVYAERDHALAAEVMKMIG